MIGRIVGGVLGAAINRERHRDPVQGAVVGAVAMFAARRVLPARFAALGATLAAAYITKKLAEREAARLRAAEALDPAVAEPALPDHGMGAAGPAHPATADESRLLVAPVNGSGRPASPRLQ